MDRRSRLLPEMGAHWMPKMGAFDYGARVHSAVQAAGSDIDVTGGLAGIALDLLAGKDYLYVDHAYFHRGWGNRNFRLIRRNQHLTHVLDRPDDRLKKFGVEIQPWRKDGRTVLVIPNSWAQMERFGEKEWLAQTLERLKRLTDRTVIVKRKKDGPFQEYLRDAWAVVTWGSVAGMEAALAGVPVFSTDRCPSWPVNAGPLEQIESPEYPERHAWACSLAYASWNLGELSLINLKDYNYAYRDDLP